jgi:hypothetical protein
MRGLASLVIFRRHAGYAADFGVGVVRLPRFFRLACSMGMMLGDRNQR